MSFTGTVIATAGGSVAIGLSVSVANLTGQNASPIGVHPSATSATPSLATGTGVTTGSLVYMALLGVAGTATANGSTTLNHNTAGNGLQYIQGRTTAATTGGVSVTVGVTGITGISICLLEILKGAGTLTESSVVNAATTSATTLTTGTVTAIASSELVVCVTANGGAGATTMAITDTFGIGLVWTNQVQQNGAGNGNTSIWTAPVPAAAASTPGMLLGMEV